MKVKKHVLKLKEIDYIYDEIPFAEYLDLKSKIGPIWQNILGVYFIRLSLALTFGETVYHPDQNWQGMEISY
jgi:hypothetical protein